MTGETNKRNSLYFQLLCLLILSACAAFLVFWGMELASSRLIRKYLEDSSYVEQRDREFMTRLQQYIDQEKLASRDTEALSRWVKAQKVLYIQIYQDGIRVFDSAYPDAEIWEEEIQLDSYAQDSFYLVEFSDGPALVNVTGIYAYQFYNYALIGDLLLSFGVFLLLVLTGIRRKMKYIRTLSREIEILEGGSLDCPITVKGKDELAALAQGLDDMRKSFQELIDQESQMIQENQRIVTEMSHDLRTPITSLMLYTEILKKEWGNCPSRQREYLDKIDEKARQMKQLTDHLFAYSLLTGEKVPMEEPAPLTELLYDLFSESSSYLEQQGFSVTFLPDWPQKKIQVSTEYLIRIMENIASNLIKYAEPSMPVVISFAEEKNMAGFAVENTVRLPGEEVESNGIGLQSIRNMMRKMGGTCQTERRGAVFRLKLLFPVILEKRR